MGDEDGVGANQNSRGALPGFGANTERWIQELLYTKRCDNELKYLKERKQNPPIGKELLAKKIQGFKVSRHPSYTDVRLATPSLVAGSTVSRASHVSRASRASRASLGARSQRSCRSSASLRGSRSEAQLPPSETVAFATDAQGRPSSAAAAGREIVAPMTPSAAEEDGGAQLTSNNFVLPKYAYTGYSMPHMYSAERGARGASSSNLRSVIKPMENTRGQFDRSQLGF
eukprot:TRINITY_DN51304_c0_g1_i1.p1 TRINITY_DN51304_c0_g1~~TRINITY_DN51304_c0_g1_i1.p1  ORF type:complete len:229 (+),score=38.25 TRINITY_DN51304_c0_g1_i1:65-751(+)